MSNLQILARSPIAPAPPVQVEAGWEVSGRRAQGELRITDRTPLAKVAVRAPWDGGMARALGVRFGRAARNEADRLVIGSGPGEWLLLAPPGTAGEVIEQVRARQAGDAGSEFVTVTDLTHGRALVRVTGERGRDVLAKVCGVDLGDGLTPDGAAFRSSVANLVTDVVRDDRAGMRSYLLHCERSSGQYLFDALLDAGAGFGMQVDGFGAD